MGGGIQLRRSTQGRRGGRGRRRRDTLPRKGLPHRRPRIPARAQPCQPGRRYPAQYIGPDPAHDHPCREEPLGQIVSEVRDAQAALPFYKFGLAETRRQPNPVTGIMVEMVGATANVDHDRAFAAKVGGETYYIKIEHDGLLPAMKRAFFIAIYASRYCL